MAASFQLYHEKPNNILTVNILLKCKNSGLKFFDSNDPISG